MAKSKSGYFWLVMYYEGRFQYCSRAIFGLLLPTLILKGSWENKLKQQNKPKHIFERQLTFAAALVFFFFIRMMTLLWMTLM